MTPKMILMRLPWANSEKTRIVAASLDYLLPESLKERMRESALCKRFFYASPSTTQIRLSLASMNPWLVALMRQISTERKTVGW